MARSTAIRRRSASCRACSCSCTSAPYSLEVDRLGWYGGAGGRRLLCLPSCDGSEAPVAQPAAPAPDANGEVDAGWSVTDSVPVGDDWVSGYCVARLVLASGPAAGESRFVPFIVREPPGQDAQILVQVPVNTWQAYNNYGGKSLYSFNSTDREQATHVSFNRPYTDNQQPVFGREVQAVRFLERSGFDVAYTTDADIDADPSELLAHPVDMVLGHDEYWTRAMRDGWDAAEAAGHDLVFLASDIGTWQVRYEDDQRTLIAYKSARDAETDPALQTTEFRKLQTPEPECQLEGVQYDENGTHPGRRDFIVTQAAAQNPWIQAAGLAPGDVITNGVTYEWDALAPGCQTPEAPNVLLHYQPPDGSGESPSDAVAFATPSGGQVFTAGSADFSWLLDDYHTPAGQAADPRVEAFVDAMLTDMTTPATGDGSGTDEGSGGGSSSTDGASQPTTDGLAAPSPSDPLPPATVFGIDPSHVDPVPTATIGHPTIVGGARVHIALACAGATSTDCLISVRLTAVEFLRHGTVVAIATHTSQKPPSGAKKRTVTLGQRTVELRGGQRSRATVHLTSAARRLLKHFRRLSLLVTTTQKLGAATQAVDRRHVLLRQKRSQ